MADFTGLPEGEEPEEPLMEEVATDNEAMPGAGPASAGQAAAEQERACASRGQPAAPGLHQRCGAALARRLCGVLRRRVSSATTAGAGCLVSYWPQSLQLQRSWPGTEQIILQACPCIKPGAAQTRLPLWS